MNQKEFEKIEDHYEKASELKDQIAAVNKLIVGMTARMKPNDVAPGGDLRFSIYRERGSRGDNGCYVTLPEKIIRAGLLPALKTALAELRQKFKEFE